MNQHQHLIAAGLTEADIIASRNDEPWDIEVIRSFIADYEDPATAARRATRAGPGVERARRIYEARKAWLAQQ